MKKTVLLLVSLFSLLIYSPVVRLDKKMPADPSCEGGHVCFSCACGGVYELMRGQDEPDNPDNKRHPRAKCTNYCTKKCCECKQKK